MRKAGSSSGDMGQSGAILITGGAGFIGSNLALHLKRNFQGRPIVAFDNLTRKGSSLNVPRLRRAGIRFLLGDIRSKSDLRKAGRLSALVECSAEPSVLAGIGGEGPAFVIDNNFNGSIRCLEAAAKHRADFIFLSTSRVYPVAALESRAFTEAPTRFRWKGSGVSENFPLEGHRSFYGASKLCSEFLIAEYRKFYGIRTVINRCGVVAGPWQMGKVDQGVAALWVARHYWKQNLQYIGYGGKGKQVRDFLHVQDLCELIELQLKGMKRLDGETFNVGGGVGISASLQELTALCRKVTGNSIPIGRLAKSRPADLRIYISDCSKLKKATGWSPRRGMETIVEDICRWIRGHEKMLKPVLGS